MKQAYVPVTESQALETNISHSVKIGKQVMKKQLKAAITKTTLEHKEIMSVLNEHEKTTHAEFDTHIRTTVFNNLFADKELTRYRNMFNKFSRFNEERGEYEKIKNNKEVARDISGVGIADYTYTSHSYLYTKILNNLDHFDNPLTQIKNNKPIEVEVETIFPDRTYPDDCDTVFLCWNYDVFIPKSIIAKMDTQLELEKARQEIGDKLVQLQDKLNNIDQVIEELEAKLLVNELQKSKEGKAALDIASDLVSEMLGSTPALLDLGKTNP